MTATVSHFRLRSAEQRVGFLESESERWATDSGEREDITAEVNRLYRELSLLDTRVQEAYFDGLLYSDELSGTIAGLFRRWLTLARKLDDTAESDELRRNVREAAAALAPADVLNDGMAQLRDAALAEHAAGQTVAGLGVE